MAIQARTKIPNTNQKYVTVVSFRPNRSGLGAAKPRAPLVRPVHSFSTTCALEPQARVTNAR